MMETVLIKNVGSGAFPVLGEMLLPGEHRRVSKKVAAHLWITRPGEVQVFGVIEEAAEAPAGAEMPAAEEPAPAEMTGKKKAK